MSGGESAVPLAYGIPPSAHRHRRQSGVVDWSRVTEGVGSEYGQNDNFGKVPKYG